MLLSHVTVGVTDFVRAAAFYDALLGPLGAVRHETDIPGGWVGWRAAEARFPTFWICRPFDRAAPHPGNGAMAGFLAPSRPALHAAYDAALLAGGTDEGAPGLRAYAPDWYGCYLRDPDRNKLCVVHRGG